MKQPNFFLIGVGKSGTTSLHDYLNQHPENFTSSPKEPFYFSPHIGVPWGVCEISRYLSLFETAGHAKRIGESSVDDMYSKVAAKNIKEFCPEAKILIVILRKAKVPVVRRSIKPERSQDAIRGVECC